MTHNDIIKRLRYALNLNDPTMIEIFKQAGHAIDLTGLKNLLKKEGEQGYAACREKVLGCFLDGLIVQKRGRRENAPSPGKKADPVLTNNAILRKIKIALELQEDDMRGILRLAGVDISRSELSAFFRSKDHKNFRECGDQVLRNFLKGLAVRYRDRSSAQ